MDVLRSVIDEKRSEPLTSVEIQHIIEECFRFNASEITQRAKYYLYIVEAIRIGKLNPDSCLGNVVKLMKTFYDVILLAILLRKGASKNLYVSAPGLGPSTHILIYAMNCLKENNALGIREYVLIILQQLGALASAAAFDSGLQTPRDQIFKSQEVGIDPLLLERISPKSPSKFESNSFAGVRTGVEPSKTVKEWFTENGLVGADDYQNLFSRLTSEQQITIGTICDLPNLAYPSPETHLEELPTASPREMGTSGAPRIPNLSITLLSQAEQIIARYPITSTLTAGILSKGSYGGFTKAIDFYSLPAFEHFLEMGLPITYFTINRLCLSLREVIRRGDTYASKIYRLMLEDTIRGGNSLDLEQLSLISTSSEPIAQNLLQLYHQPMWRKSCSIRETGSLPNNLRKLVFNLGISPARPKKEICAELSRLSEADAEALKAAARSRQQMRLTRDLSSITDFVAGSPSQVVCSNSTVLQKDPFLYNDATLSFYRDGGGSVWCFTSEMYPTLLETQMNPHKPNERLPESFLEQIRLHLKMMETLEISPLDAMTSVEAINSLSTPDEVSNTESKRLVETFERASLYKGCKLVDIPRTDRGLSLEKMRLLLNLFEPELGEVLTDLMTDQHRYFTFVRMALEYLKKGDELSRRFFESLCLQTSR